MALDRASVIEAARRIEGFVLRTPVLRSDGLDKWIGATVFVKAEHQQRMGAFKYRGATNAVQSLADDEAQRGVAAHSSGNHAAALALAASTRGIPAHVVMPDNTSAVKRAAVEQYGAHITWCEPTLAALGETLASVLAATGAIEIHPYDDERVIAGAGTAALELLDEIADLDALVVPIGGGGLASGTCLAATQVRVIGGHPVDRTATIADGLRTGCSDRTNAILDAHNVERIAIPESEIGDAVAQARDRLGDHIEPSAAIAFAAARRTELAGARVGIICSGGNVDG